jgi:hypothetical protein
MTPTPTTRLPQPITIRYGRDYHADTPTPGSFIASDLPSLEKALDELHLRAVDADRPLLITLHPTPTGTPKQHAREAGNQTTTGPILAITVGADQALVTWTYLYGQADTSPLAVVSTNGTTDDEPSFDVDDATGGRSEFPAWMLIPTTTARAAARTFATNPNTPPGNITWTKW